MIDGFASRDAMLATSRALRDAGFPSEKSAANTLTISRIASEAQANDLGARLKADFDLSVVKTMR